MSAFFYRVRNKLHTNMSVGFTCSSPKVGLYLVIGPQPGSYGLLIHKQKLVIPLNVLNLNKLKLN